MFVADLVWNERNFMDLFTAKYGYVNADLAPIYNVPPPKKEFERIVFTPESERAKLIPNPLVADYVDFFAGNDFKRLTTYLKNKYVLDELKLKLSELEKKETERLKAMEHAQKQ